MHQKEYDRPVIRFGPFTLDRRSGELCKGPTRLKVPAQSISVLQALVERPGELVTREELRDRLWPPDTFVDFEAGLNAAVRRLREALSDSADVPLYIETLPRRGYRFIASLESTSPAPPGLVRSGPQVAGTSETARTGRVSPWYLGLGVLALLIGSGLWFGLRKTTAESVVERPVPITSFPGLELDPSISPTGTLVAFAGAGESGDNFDIYVRPIGGSASATLRLTTDAAPDHAPAWSPDGQRIAFERVLGGRRVIFWKPALGGPEHRLFDAGPEGGWIHGGPSDGLSWTRDGKHLVFGHWIASGPTSAISMYSVDDGWIRQLTRPPPNFRDIHPVVSPDGRYLAFIRQKAVAGGDIFLQKFEDLQLLGEPVPVTAGRTVHAFDWTQDGLSLIHDGGYTIPGLWRVPIAGGASELVLPNMKSGRPSVARTGLGLVYQNYLSDIDIWELPTPSSMNRQSSGDPTFPVIASTFTEADMQFSSDATRIAFVSRRSGHMQLWVSNRDGSELNQLTHDEGGGRVGSPAWSDDGQWIAYDASPTNGAWSLHVVRASGGPGRTLAADASSYTRPSWSRDGRWIYFSSDRGGDWQIWRVPSGGGTPAMITRGGGRDPVVSLDGSIYYAKSAPTEGIWKVPAEGGEEVEVVGRGRQLLFDVADTGIFMLNPSATPQATIDMFSFASQEVVPLARLPAGVALGPYLSVSRDGRSILYVRFALRMSDIEILPTFR